MNICDRNNKPILRLTNTLDLEEEEAEGEEMLSLSIVYTGRAEAAARMKYMFLPAEAAVVKRRRNVAIFLLIINKKVG